MSIEEELKRRAAQHERQVRCYEEMFGMAYPLAAELARKLGKGIDQMLADGDFETSI